MKGIFLVYILKLTLTGMCEVEWRETWVAFGGTCLALHSKQRESWLWAGGLVLQHISPYHKNCVLDS